MMRCCICSASVIDDPYGHNAQPIASGRCCGYCNDTVVVPERFKQLGLQQHSLEGKMDFVSSVLDELKEGIEKLKKVRDKNR